MRVLRPAVLIALLLMLAACAPANTPPPFTLVPSLTPTTEAATPAASADRYANLPQAATALGFPQLGFPNAPVSLVLYSAFDCADCARFFSEVLPRLLQRIRASEVLLTFVPIYDAQSTGNGETAARAALCASEQNRFWQYYDLLLTQAATAPAAAFTPEQLITFVENIGLERAQWDACMLSARPAQTLSSAIANASDQFNSVLTPPLAVIVSNDRVPPDLTSVDNAISVAAARVDAAIQAAIAATNTPSVNSTPDPAATAPVVVTLQPLQNQPIPPPITIGLPQGWRTGNDTLVLNDIDGMRSIPFTIYTGPVSNGVGSIVLLWGFPNLVAGNPFDVATPEPDLFTDGLRLLRLAIVETGCNIGTDLRRQYNIGGLAAFGTQFSAVTCPELPDTRGWFAGLQQNGINFIFYTYADPIEAIDGARAELQSILDSVRFVLPTPSGE
jgi:hypothetical protein